MTHSSWAFGAAQRPNTSGKHHARKRPLQHLIAAATLLMMLTSCGGFFSSDESEAAGDDAPQETAASETPSSEPDPTEASTEPSEEPSQQPSTEPSETTDPFAEVEEPPDALVEIPMTEGQWGSFGPFVAEGSFDSRNHSDVDGASDAHVADGPLRLFIPNVGDAVVDANIILPNEEVTNERYTYTHDQNGHPVLVGLWTIRHPGSGLDAEQFISETVVIDIEVSRHIGMTIEAGMRTELPEDIDIEANIATSTSGVIALNSFPASTFGGYEGDRFMIGVDVFAGDIIWQHQDRRIARMSREVALTTETGSTTDVDDVWGIDLVSGEEIWHLVPPNILHVTHGEDYRHGYIVVGGYNGECRDLYPFSPDGGREVYDDVYNPAAMDRVQNLALDLPIVNRCRDYDHAMRIVDLETNEVIFSLDVEQAEALNAQYRSLHDGLLYIETTDDTPVVDVRTGEIVGQWDIYPRGMVANYTWLSDDTLNLHWEFDAATGP